MKKQLLLFVSMLLPMVAMADDSGSCGTNVTYTYVSSTGTLTIQGSGAMTDYSYNSDVPWYSYRADIKTVVIKDGVTSIGRDAFEYCTGLTFIEIPNSVTSIGITAFMSCTSLASVTIGNSVTSILYGAFWNCSGLTSVTIPNSVTSIGNLTFYYCSGLTSIEIPNSVTSIGVQAFDDTAWYNNQPNGLVYAGKVAYKYKGTMPDNTNITIKEGTLGIAGGAFSDCTGLTSIEIPNSVTSIGDRAFSSCGGLTSVTIPNSVTSIGISAFYGCSGLTSIEIPNSVTSIGIDAFEYCTGLTFIEIPNSVTSINDYAFSGCSGLTSITIPNSVTSIGISAFYGCSGLTSIEIPNSVTSIGSYAFKDCSGLTSVTIPNSVTSIGEYAFYNCSGLTSIEIPNSVTSIGYSAFWGCSGLTSVTVELESPLTIDNSTFSNRANATLYVPYGSKAAYEAANYWKEFKEIIEMPGPRCATPTISFKGGKLHFECETSDVTYHYTITPPSKTDNTGNDVEVGSSYTVQVYATKDGYQDSDIATQDIDIRGIKGDVNDDGDVTAQDASLILQKVAGK